MAEPINLNRARKARARADAKTQAVENRVRFGRTGAEKAAARADAERAARALDGAEREPKDQLRPVGSLKPGPDT